MLTEHVGAYGRSNIATLRRVSESVTSALRALIEDQASEQHGPSDNCSMARCAFTFEVVGCEPQTHKRWLNISLTLGAQVNVVLLCR